MSKSKRWGQDASVDDPGRREAVKDHTYQADGGSWQMPKDTHEYETEVEREIAKLTAHLAAEPGGSDGGRAPSRTAEAAGGGRGAWFFDGRVGDHVFVADNEWAQWANEKVAEETDGGELHAELGASSDEDDFERTMAERDARYFEAGSKDEDDDGCGPGGAADPAWTGEIDDHGDETEVEA